MAIVKGHENINTGEKGQLSNLGNKAIPVTGDKLLIEDGADSDIKKEIDADYLLNKANETGIDQITGSIITPTQLTGNVDNYSPTGFSTANMIRQDLDASLRSISGFVAPPAGVARIIRICNLNNTTFDLRFLHDNVGSDADNRILLRDAAMKDLHPNETAGFWYDHISNRWRVLNRVG